MAERDQLKANQQCHRGLFDELLRYFNVCLSKVEAAEPGATYPDPSVVLFCRQKGLKPRDLPALVKKLARSGDTSGVNAISEVTAIELQIARIAASKRLRPNIEIEVSGA